MANRSFEEKVLNLVKNLAVICGDVVIGATGAVGTVTGNGIASVTRVSAGKYTITLDDSYQKFVNLVAAFYEGGAGNPLVFQVNVFSDPDSATLGLPNKLLTIQCRDAAGAAVDPANGAVLKLSIWARNSGLKQKGEA